MEMPMHCHDALILETALAQWLKSMFIPCKSCKKCLRKAEMMLGTLLAQISQPFKVTSRTARTVQMCSQSEDTATNSLETAVAIAICFNCLPPPAEVLGDNLDPTPIRAGGTNISGALREPMTQPASQHTWLFHTVPKQEA